ncbi:tripartite motif-containing protein 16, partial [Larimichthys crocea]|uniref:tripartite motif-containing protein 16 n=1 Tax=Larimichthys crocea TaxID=215358 RepID=UPI000F5E5B66
LHAAPADHCYAGPEDVSCDCCTGRKRKATKSCLQCQVSYCEQHLQPHYEVVPFKKHKLIEASAKLQENICTRHNEVMKIFCHDDQKCICYLCSMDEHKGHSTVIAEAEMTKRKGEIGPKRRNIQQRIQDREKYVTMLQQEVEAINRSADKAMQDSEEMSTELVHLIEGKNSHVKCEIKSQQAIEVSRVKGLQEKLEQELGELRKRDADLEKLSRTEDQTQFLHDYFSLSRLRKSTVLPKTNISPLRYFEDVTTAVSEARAELLKTNTKEWKKISMTVTGVEVLLPQDPKTRTEFSHYAVYKHELKLDPNTANMRLVFSEENRKVALVRDEQSYCNHSDRFIDKPQVLSRKPLTGRCYWEVQWSGLGLSVAVAYKDIARTGEESAFGNNDKSWVLECLSKGNYNFKHDGNRTPIPAPQSPRLGVFLDFKAGILIFYGISTPEPTVLHRVQTTFTQPLYAGLGVCYFGATAEFCDVK